MHIWKGGCSYAAKARTTLKSTTAKAQTTQKPTMLIVTIVETTPGDRNVQNGVCLEGISSDAQLIVPSERTGNVGGPAIHQFNGDGACPEGIPHDTQATILPKQCCKLTHHHR